MDFLPGVVRQTGVVSGETKLGEQLCDQHSSRLLTVHTDSKRLHTTQEEEGVKRRERIAD